MTFACEQTSANASFYFLSLFFVLLWKDACLHAALWGGRNKDYQLFWVSVPTVHTYLLSWDSTFPKVLISTVLNCSDQQERSENKIILLEQTFYDLNPHPDITGVNGIFFFFFFFPLLTWWKQPVPSKPREGRVTGKQLNLGEPSCTCHASPPLFHPSVPPLSPHKPQEAAKPDSRGKGFWQRWM